MLRDTLQKLKSRIRRAPLLNSPDRRDRERIQRTFHNDAEAALEAYFVHNGDDAESRANYDPEMIRRAVEFNYLSWPRKIRDEVQGKDILDVGCGTGLHAVGFLVVGVKSYTGLDPKINLASDRSKNLRARRHDRFGWTPAQMQERLPRVRLIPGTFEQVAPEDRFDVAVLHNVTEHLMSIDDVIEGVWERLRPGGTIVYNHHNFFCWNGHHQAPKFVNEIDWQDPEQMKFVDWNHLAYEPAADHYLATGLNKIRMDDLRALTDRLFEIEVWNEIPSKKDRGRGRLTGEIRRRFPDVTDREFATQNVFCRGRKRPEPLSGT